MADRMFTTEGDLVDVGRPPSVPGRNGHVSPPPDGLEAAAPVLRRLSGRVDRQVRLLDRLRSDPLAPEPPGLPELLDTARQLRHDTESLLLLAGEDTRPRAGGVRQLSTVLDEAVDATDEPLRVDVRSGPSATVGQAAAIELLHVVAEVVDHVTAVHPAGRVEVSYRPEAPGGIVVDIRADGATRHDPGRGKRGLAAAERMAQRSRSGIVLRVPVPTGGALSQGPIASVHCPAGIVTIHEPGYGLPETGGSGPDGRPVSRVLDRFGPTYSGADDGPLPRSDPSPLGSAGRTTDRPPADQGAPDPDVSGATLFGPAEGEPARPAPGPRRPANLVDGADGAARTDRTDRPARADRPRGVDPPRADERARREERALNGWNLPDLRLPDLPVLGAPSPDGWPAPDGWSARDDRVAGDVLGGAPDGTRPPSPPPVEAGGYSGALPPGGAARHAGASDGAPAGEGSSPSSPAPRPRASGAGAPSPGPAPAGRADAGRPGRAASGWSDGPSEGLTRGPGATPVRSGQDRDGRDHRDLGHRAPVGRAADGTGLGTAGSGRNGLRPTAPGSADPTAPGAGSDRSEGAEPGGPGPGIGGPGTNGRGTGGSRAGSLATGASGAGDGRDDGPGTDGVGRGAPGPGGADRTAPGGGGPGENGFSGSAFGDPSPFERSAANGTARDRGPALDRRPAATPRPEGRRSGHRAEDRVPTDNRLPTDDRVPTEGRAPTGPSRSPFADHRPAPPTHTAGPDAMPSTGSRHTPPRRRSAWDSFAGSAPAPASDPSTSVEPGPPRRSPASIRNGSGPREHTDELFGPMLGLPVEEPGSANTPIFEAVASAWFRDDPEPTPRGGPLDWESPSDGEWRAAAERASLPDASPLTAQGLPRRRPGGQLVPPRPAAPEVSDQADRVPDRIRERLSGYQRGLHQGRHRAEPGDPGDPTAW